MEKLFSTRLQIILQVLGVAIVLINAFVASQLVPLALNINSITGRVNAIEKELEGRPEILERFFKLEEKVSTIVTNVNSIDKKVDTIINQYIDLRNILK